VHWVPIFDGEDYDKLEQLALQVETSASGQFEMTGDASTESLPVAYPQNNESDNSDATPVSTSSVEGVPIFSGAYSADSSDYIHDLTINNAGHASDVTSYSISGANHTTKGAAISGTGANHSTACAMFAGGANYVTKGSLLLCGADVSTATMSAGGTSYSTEGAMSAGGTNQSTASAVSAGGTNPSTASAVSAGGTNPSTASAMSAGGTNQSTESSVPAGGTSYSTEGANNSTEGDLGSAGRASHPTGGATSNAIGLNYPTDCVSYSTGSALYSTDGSTFAAGGNSCSAMPVNQKPDSMPASAPVRTAFDGAPPRSVFVEDSRVLAGRRESALQTNDSY
jgi:hypothetical protein